MSYGPIATYRLQLRPEFDFSACGEILDYLGELGISDIYASPIFKSVPESSHGYDVCDHREINPELGGEPAFDILSDARRRAGLGWIQDLVPNHMAVSGHNPLLVDLFENGPDSRYFSFFDVDWNHPDKGLTGRVLAPFLGGFYGQTLENGELNIEYDEQGFFVRYYEFRLPLRLDSYAHILTHNIRAYRDRAGNQDPDYLKLLGVLYSIRNLGSAEETEEYYQQIMFIKRLLFELYESSGEFKSFLMDNLDRINARTGTLGREQYDLMDEILNEQYYRLSFWKVAADEINYRRFFSINDLISIRVEEEPVFDYAHDLVLRKFHEGAITGLRIDHIDGLYDPAEYLTRLRNRARSAYITVEKILHPDEELPPDWPVEGTTGYDFMNRVNRVLCNTDAESAFNRIYRTITGFGTDYAAVFREKRRIIIEEDMAGDVQNLARRMQNISLWDRHARDVTLYRLHRALMEVLAVFPVYRTYVNPESFTENDRRYIETAISEAIRLNPPLRNELTFIRRFLLLDFPEYLGDEEKSEWLQFAMRFQQFTGPLMAKGFEDTALYVYNRLISLNEVGGDPGRFGSTIEEFHAHMTERARLRPHSLNATATHDTKRGEDHRIRITVLSEIPDEWERTVGRWYEINESKKSFVHGRFAPDRNDEYFLYQTLVGSYPILESEQADYRDRLTEYVVKAVREAKVHTAWLQPDTEYEQAFVSFVDGVLTDSDDNEFLQSFKPFHRRIAHLGVLNGLTQVLLKITAPGVPDFYQGTELWDLSFVDPDNRRPVDYDLRRRYLAEMPSRSADTPTDFITDLLGTKHDGRLKFFCIVRALAVRRECAAVFRSGDYKPPEIAGSKQRNIVCFARELNDRTAVILAPRLCASLVDDEEFPLGESVWHDTEIRFPDLPAGTLTDAFTGRNFQATESLFVGDVLSDFPVALLTSTEESS